MKKFLLRCLLFVVVSLAMFSGYVLIEIHEKGHYHSDRVTTDLLKSFLVMLVVFIPYERIYRYLRRQWK